MRNWTRGGSDVPTERQLANLRPPIRRGEVLNPEGRNQWTQRRAAFDAIVDVLREAPPELAEPLRERLVEAVIEGALDGSIRL
jgi:hypothetical protein